MGLSGNVVGGDMFPTIWLKDAAERRSSNLDFGLSIYLSIRIFSHLLPYFLFPFACFFVSFLQILAISISSLF